MSRPVLTLRRTRTRVEAPGRPVAAHRAAGGESEAARPDAAGRAPDAGHALDISPELWARIAAIHRDGRTAPRWCRDVLRAAVRGQERRGAGGPVRLVLAAAPPDMGARLARAAERAGMETASEWAIRALAEALDREGST